MIPTNIESNKQILNTVFSSFPIKTGGGGNFVTGMPLPYNKTGLRSSPSALGHLSHERFSPGKEQKEK